MKPFLALAAAASLLGGVARAQTPAAAPSRGYVEGVAQAASSDVTSQSFGVEAGYAVMPRLQAFVDVGRVRDAAPSEAGASALAIAGFLSQTETGVAFQVKAPITFGVAGVRYTIDTGGRLQPYVLGGAGVARVERNVGFTIGGADVTSSLQQYGVVLGTDLSGSETKPMMTIGGGVTYPAWQRLVLDLQVRYGRILTSDQGLNLIRAGIGVGVVF